MLIYLYIVQHLWSAHFESTEQLQQPLNSQGSTNTAQTGIGTCQLVQHFYLSVVSKEFQNFYWPSTEQVWPGLFCEGQRLWTKRCSSRPHLQPTHTFQFFSQMCITRYASNLIIICNNKRQLWWHKVFSEQKWHSCLCRIGVSTSNITVPLLWRMKPPFHLPLSQEPF